MSFFAGLLLFPVMFLFMMFAANVLPIFEGDFITRATLTFALKASTVVAAYSTLLFWIGCVVSKKDPTVA
jgi:hypothetical protein